MCHVHNVMMVHLRETSLTDTNAGLMFRNVRCLSLCIHIFNLIARMEVRRYGLSFYRYSLSCICIESNECVLVEL